MGKITQMRQQRKAFHEDIGRQLAAARLEKHLSVETVSAHIRRSGAYIEHIETGQGDIWLNTLYFMASFYDKNVLSGWNKKSPLYRGLSFFKFF